MADLRALVSGLGFTDLKTILNSGNVIFRGDSGEPGTIAGTIADAVESSRGFTANVVVVTLPEIEKIVAANPFEMESADPSRLLVAFAADAADLEPAGSLAEDDWNDERIAVQGSAAFLSVPGGVADSVLVKAFEKATRGSATARNWATVLKIRDAARAIGN